MKGPAQITTHQIEHVRVRTDRPFAEVVRSLESQTGLFDVARITNSNRAEVSSVTITDAVNAMAGASGFMRFAAWDHGAVLRLSGQHSADAVRFVIGNPLIAARLTRRNIGAGLYAPLSLLVSSDERGGTLLDYDRPSTLFAQFEEAEIDRTAYELDRKLEALIEFITALYGSDTPSGQLHAPDAEHKGIL